MGNHFLRALNMRTTLIAGADTWIEGNAIHQLEVAAKLEGMHAVAGMPDLHAGRGYPIGAAFFSIGQIYPALVGNDIGCGMSLWQTDMRYNLFKPDKVQKQLGSIDSPLTAQEREQLLSQDEATEHTAMAAPGTIGGGNHFAELQRVDTVYDEDLATCMGLDTRYIQLLVHSGSRSLGEHILRSHMEQHGYNGLSCDTPLFEHYIQQHNTALDYARVNRKLVALRMLKQLKAHGQCMLDIFHNMVLPATVQGKRGWLHRKGAAPADQGMVVIPGSRGDYSYVVQPLLDTNSEKALFSVAHGAGRKWMRSECKGRLKRFTSNALNRSLLGSRLICSNNDLVYEEAPQAYKPIDSVIHALEGAGLIHKVARLVPMLTYKMQSER